MSPAILFLLLVAQVPQQRANELVERALAAKEKSDHPKYLEHLEKANRLGAEHPLVLYRLAGAYALVGKKKESIAVLQRIADLGLAFEPEKDPDFESLKSTPELGRVVERFAANLVPTTNSRIAFVLPEQYGVLEAITYDATQKRFLIGTVTTRKIVAVTQQGQVRALASEKEGLWSILGLSVDEPRGVFWAATTAMGEKRRSALVKLDLRDGKVIGSYPVAHDDKEHVLASVVVTSSGDVFATDRTAPAIHRLPKDGDELEYFFASDVLQSPEGLCLSRDEKKLFVADYSRGIFAIDVATKKAVQLQVPASATVAGIDGLYCYQGDLIATQNGFRPDRVLRIALDASGTAVTKVSVLESNHPEFGEISLGVIVGDTLFYAAAPAKILKLAL